MKKAYAYTLKVLDVQPARKVENQLITVKFHLEVRQFGVSGPEPGPVTIEICPRPRRPESTCVRYLGARNGRTYNGEVATLAPAAGLMAPVTLVVLEQPSAPVGGSETYSWPDKAEDTLQVPVAARYEVALESFEITHTRSARTDTLWAILNGKVDATPPHISASETACKTEGFRWCVSSRYGDAQDGTHQLRDVRVGPFELVPGRETSLQVFYSLVNIADDDVRNLQETGEDVANGFSMVGQIILGAYGAQSGNSTTSVAGQLHGGMEKLHGAMFAGCDGATVADVVVFPNAAIDSSTDKTLDAWTGASGAYRPPYTKVYEGGDYIDGDTRCGAGGKYRVRYAIYRTSWRSWP